MKREGSVRASSPTGLTDSGQSPHSRPGKCLACGGKMNSLGRMKVLTGLRAEVRGMMIDPLLAQQQQAVPLEMFVCDDCGRVEFYDASEKVVSRR